MAPDPDDALLDALGQAFRDQEAEADALWPAEGTLAPLTAKEADAVFAALPDALAPPGGKVLAFPARRRWLASGVGLALAAALAVFLLTRGPALAPLPGYQLSATAGDQLQRGPEDPQAGAVARYTPGSRLVLVARPATDLAQAPQVHVWLAQGDALTRLDVPVQVSPTGAVKVELEAGASLPAKPGPGAVVLVVRPAGLDTPDDALIQAADPAPAQVLRHPFVFSAEP
ncbi:MAG: hypothetical protein KC613_06760 [Myxococcales bacterium]|nr:hypothetical protein [Myxococcales bacterium]MCB9522450.1 hypothetical protein [Myxococcales bacterium]